MSGRWIKVSRRSLLLSIAQSKNTILVLNCFLNEIHIYKYRCVSFATLTRFQMITNCFAVILFWSKRQTLCVEWIRCWLSLLYPMVKLIPKLDSSLIVQHKFAFDSTSQIFLCQKKNNYLFNYLYIVRLWIHQLALYCECLIEVEKQTAAK